jgi:hypothetical protein
MTDLPELYLLEEGDDLLLPEYAQFKRCLLPLLLGCQKRCGICHAPEPYLLEKGDDLLLPEDAQIKRCLLPLLLGCIQYQDNCPDVWSIR